VWGGARAVLRAAGHDVVWAGEWPTDPGDDEILSYAHRDHRVLVTLDKDFGELAVVFRRPHSGIMRLVNLAARQQGTVCLRVLELYGEELQSGAITTATLDRIRIRAPEL
jgi:predicted nuclease of predicted toxin-antitoxin system